jgi:hypothetical protein
MKMNKREEMKIEAISIIMGIHNRAEQEAWNNNND